MNLLKYSLLRLVLIALAFFVCYYFGVGLILSIIFAAIIGFAVAYLAFPKLNDAAAADFNAMLKRRSSKKKKTVEDENQAFEDAYVDSNVEVLEPESSQK